MKLSRRWNKFWIGFAPGIMLPLTVFILIYFISYSKTPFVIFIKFIYMSQMLPKILSLCAVSNFAIFYLFLNKEYWYATRGVIAATLLFALGVGITLFLV